MKSEKSIDNLIDRIIKGSNLLVPLDKGAIRYKKYLIEPFNHRWVIINTENNSRIMEVGLRVSAVSIARAHDGHFWHLIKQVAEADRLFECARSNIAHYQHTRQSTNIGDLKITMDFRSLTARDQMAQSHRELTGIFKSLFSSLNK